MALNSGMNFVEAAEPSNSIEEVQPKNRFSAEARRLRSEAERMELLVALENSELAAAKSKEEYFREISILGSQMYEIEMERNELLHKLNQRDNELASAEQQFETERADWNSKFLKLNERYAQLEAQFQIATEKLKSENERSVKIQSDLEAERRQILRLNEQINAFTDNESQLNAKLKAMLADKLELQQLLKESEESRKRTIEIHETMSKDFASKEEEAREQIEILEADLEMAIAEKATLHKVVSIRESCFEAERRDLDRKIELLKRREEQLKKYASTLNEEKQNMRKASHQLGREFQASVALHPLKDCLTFTEAEIDRVEAHLRRIPTISMERPKFEETLKQLTDQRRFLRSLIESSTQQAEKHAQSLMGINSVSSAIGAAVPPPAPFADSNL